MKQVLHADVWFSPLPIQGAIIALWVLSAIIVLACVIVFIQYHVMPDTHAARAASHGVLPPGSHGDGQRGASPPGSHGDGQTWQEDLYDDPIEVISDYFITMHSAKDGVSTINDRRHEKSHKLRRNVRVTQGKSRLLRGAPPLWEFHYPGPTGPLGSLSSDSTVSDVVEDSTISPCPGDLGVYAEIKTPSSDCSWKPGRLLKPRCDLPAQAAVQMRILSHIFEESESASHSDDVTSFTSSGSEGSSKWVRSSASEGDPWAVAYLVPRQVHTPHNPKPPASCPETEAPPPPEGDEIRVSTPPDHKSPEAERSLESEALRCVSMRVSGWRQANHVGSAPNRAGTPPRDHRMSHSSTCPEYSLHDISNIETHVNDPEYDADDLTYLGDTADDGAYTYIPMGEVTHPDIGLNNVPGIEFDAADIGLDAADEFDAADIRHDAADSGLETADIGLDAADIGLDAADIGLDIVACPQTSVGDATPPEVPGPCMQETDGVAIPWNHLENATAKRDQQADGERETRDDTSDMSVEMAPGVPGHLNAAECKALPDLPASDRRESVVVLMTTPTMYGREFLV